jgi:nickel/cobalt exporter
LLFIFIIFIFGPCEPLISLVMYPASEHNILAVALVASVFGAVTIGTMIGIVMTSHYGPSKLPLRSLERHSHALVGLTIFSGVAIKLLGP